MLLNKKKILFVTSTRALWKIKSYNIKCSKNKKFESRVFVTGMHNIKLYGSTVGELIIDKIKGIYFHKNQNKLSKMDEILINTIRAFHL